jgi:hypothetical protein
MIQPDDLAAWADAHGLAVSFVSVPGPATSLFPWPEDARHYAATLTLADRPGALDTPWSEGPAGDHATTTAAEVLECLISDALSVEEADDMWSWWYDMGSGPIESAEHGRDLAATWRSVVKLSAKLRAWLGPDLARELLEW